MTQRIRDTAQELADTLGEYAFVMGEAWRIGEGAELMDALQALQEELAK